MFKQQKTTPKPRFLSPSEKLPLEQKLHLLWPLEGSTKQKVRRRPKIVVWFLKDVKEISRAQGKPGGSPQKANNQKITPTITSCKN